MPPYGSPVVCFRVGSATLIRHSHWWLDPSIGALSHPMHPRDLAISVQSLGKAYTIWHDAEKHSTAAEALLAQLRNPLKRSCGETFWAIDDLSVEIAKGEVVGIIGRNGAGKSTLLKILSRITEPTRGRVELYGRVGSLLEVGTGFHPELTGRENIFLNGAILGMRKAEIDRQFDAIVAFAGVEKFLDTPVKRYSSGMYVRLAFAVAAHLNPEILIVDEVLAVGDSEFQQKCLGKMKDVAGEGRTVLFVTHNMAVVQALCQRAILLQSGRIASDGLPSGVVSAYLRSIESAADLNLAARQDRRGTGKSRLIHLDVQTVEEFPSRTLITGRPARISAELSHPISSGACAITIYDHYGVAVTGFDSRVLARNDATDGPLTSRFTCEIGEILLVPGRYRINVRIMSGGEIVDHVEAAAVFEVEEGEVGGRPIQAGHSYGHVVFPHQWQHSHGSCGAGVTLPEDEASRGKLHSHYACTSRP